MSASTRRLTIQEQRSAYDIPVSIFDAECDTCEDQDNLEHYFDHWWYDSPWSEDLMPEWTWHVRPRLNPDTYWHPWAEWPPHPTN